jgi:hypothetical protein
MLASYNSGENLAKPLKSYAAKGSRNDLRGESNAISMDIFLYFLLLYWQM